MILKSLQICNHKRKSLRCQFWPNGRVDSQHNTLTFLVFQTNFRKLDHLYIYIVFQVFDHWNPSNMKFQAEALKLTFLTKSTHRPFKHYSHKFYGRNQFFELENTHIIYFQVKRRNWNFKKNRRVDNHLYIKEIFRLSSGLPHVVRELHDTSI